MQLTDNRKEAAPKFLSAQDQIIAPHLVPEIERLFDRSVSDALLDLFENKQLGGTEVLTYARHVAEPAGIRISAQSKMRGMLERVASGDLDALAGRPPAGITVRLSVGWHNLTVVPEGGQTAYIPGADLSDLEVASGPAHYLWVGKRHHEILDVDTSSGGARVHLLEPIETGIYHGASIHAGAESYAAELTRLRDEQGRSVRQIISRDRAYSDEAPPAVEMEFESLPGEHALVLSLRNSRESRTHRISRMITVEAAPRPTDIEFAYDIRTPMMLNSDSYTNLLLRRHTVTTGFTLHKPAAGAAAVVGLQYRIGSFANGDWRFGDMIYQPLPASAITYQLSDDDQSSRSFAMRLSDRAAGINHLIELMFIDEVGRTVRHLRSEIKPARPADASPVLLNEEVGKDFGRFLIESARPLQVNPNDMIRQASESIDRMKVYAESVVIAHAASDVYVEDKTSDEEDEEA